MLPTRLDMCIEQCAFGLRPHREQLAAQRLRTVGRARWVPRVHAQPVLLRLARRIEVEAIPALVGGNPPPLAAAGRPALERCGRGRRRLGRRRLGRRQPGRRRQLGRRHLECGDLHKDAARLGAARRVEGAGARRGAAPRHAAQPNLREALGLAQLEACPPAPRLVPTRQGAEEGRAHPLGIGSTALGSSALGRRHHLHRHRAAAAAAAVGDSRQPPAERPDGLLQPLRSGRCRKGEVGGAGEGRLERRVEGGGLPVGEGEGEPLVVAGRRGIVVAHHRGHRGEGRQVHEQLALLLLAPERAIHMPYT